MKARKLSALILCACTVAVLLALPAVAQAAYVTNAECLACHDQATGAGAVTKVDFATGTSVDYAKCNACHWIGMSSYVYSFSHGHATPAQGYSGGLGCAGCHGGIVDNADPSRLPLVQTAYGVFNSAASLDLPADAVHAAHVNGSWPKEKFYRPSACSSCHAPTACSMCHSSDVAHGVHVASQPTTYPPVTVMSAGGTLPNQSGYNVVSVTSSCSTPACHNTVNSGSGAFVPACGSCHLTKTSEHGYGSTDHVADNGDDLEPGSTTVCRACHSTDLMAEHAKPTSAGPRSCATCHPSPRNAFDEWDQGCDQCHGVGTTPAKHTMMADKHSGATSADCVTCHATSLQALHADAAATVGAAIFSSCLVCHNAATAATLPGKTCVSCHFAFAGHYDTTKHTSTWTLGTSCAGVGCHVAGDSDLNSVHNNFRTTFSCAECHGSTRPEVIAAIAANQTACVACHTGASQNEGHRALHMADPPLMSGSSPPVPEYSYWTGSAGTSPTSDCIGCHTSNLVDEHMGVRDGATWAHIPRTDATGAALTCASCHASPDTRVITAITLGLSSCESCHVVHAPIPEVHTSTFAATQAVPCADCHSTDLTSVHNYGMVATTPSGASLTGCAFCHGYFEGSRGAAIQAAIDGNQTACAACHAGGHSDLGGHLAPADANCSGCHVVGDVRPLHATRTEGECAVCHDNPGRVGPISEKTAACASCHASIETAISSHPAYASAHASSQTDCDGSGCHAIGDLTALHSDATTTVAGVPYDGCAVCHRSPTDQPTSADCTSCHVGHGDITAKHTAPAGGSCSQCHADEVLPVHVDADLGPCDVCHDNASRVVDIRTKTAACASCHEPYTAAGTEHTAYASAHISTRTDCDGSGCHAIGDLTALHSKATTTVAGVTYTACAVCHQSPTKQPASADCTTCHGGHGNLTVAHTALVSGACFECHETNDVRTLHADSPKGECAVCHDNPVVPDLPATAECVNCHVTLSPPDPAHYVETSHTASAVTGDCYKCHKLSMDAEHSKSTVSPAVSCVSCHEGKVDAFTGAWNKTCAPCHTTTHGGQTIAHKAVTSGSCAGAGCHAVVDVAAIHANAKTADGSLTGCYVCHQNSDTLPTSAECATCHGDHGDLAVAHTALSSGTCVGCHTNADVRALHEHSSLGECAVCHDNSPRVASLPATADCVNCHASYSPPGSAHYNETTHTASAQTGSGCTDCHSMTMSAEHSKSTILPPVTCVSCHTSAKFAALGGTWNQTCDACHLVATRHSSAAEKHESANTTCDGVGCHDVTAVDVLHVPSDSGCTVCHEVGVVARTDCASAGCHAGVGTDHKGLHDASAVIDPGCKGCHFTNLVDEHAALGYSCATCHGPAAVAVVGAAILANDVACDACHPAVNGKDRHAAQNSMEFNKGNSGGHRAYSALPFMKTSFVVGSATYTWSAPTTFLKTGWTTTSMVTCDKCHTFTTTAAGPHGSAVKVNMDPAYPTSWKTVYLSGGSSGASSSTFICAKCHTSFGSMNDVHDESDHEGSSDGKCIACHSQVPHAWRLPRLLAYKDDPAPYNSLYLTGIRLKNYTPTNWSDNDCSQSGCDKHSSSMSNRWPSAVQSFGTVAGTVTGSSGAIVGATVTAGGKTATTGGDGRYSLADLPIGTTSVSVTAVGYVGQTSSASIAADKTTTVDFRLVKCGALTGTVSIAGDGVLSAATVAIAGGGSATTGSTGEYTLANLLPGTYSVTYSKNGYVSQTLSLTVTDGETLTRNVALAAAPASSNLALGKTFTASRTYTHDNTTAYAASKAGDGSTATYWWSGSSGSSYDWLRVDLGASTSVSKVEVAWYGSRYATEFRVYTSTDGSSWGSYVYSTSSGGSGTRTITFSGRNARYVKVECRRASSYSNGYGIAELRVFH